MNNAEPLLAFFGHHKCASTWIRSILLPVCIDLNLNFVNLIDRKKFEEHPDFFIDENKVEFLSYVDAKIQHVKKLKKILGFHIIRDPRDIIVSAYFSHLYSHPTDYWPWLIKHRSELQRINREEGLLLEMECRKWQFLDMYNWDYEQKNILELKMEDIISSPYETMMDVFWHLNLVNNNSSLLNTLTYSFASSINRLHGKYQRNIPFSIKMRKMPIEMLLKHVFQNRFSKMTGGRKRGEEDARSHYRKGISGDWVNYFTGEHRDAFKEKYNDLLIKLGYEKDANW